ncbi:hypothetical protein DFH08DRAFT_799599 [Mycena albidolilacea]|uniref:Peptidase A1 domain-containing protein n=1 Tax=Mycena albidolilacea TaxID=1033008 RepID=A0AAD7ALZ8_9AGAR|nr:hypothetical protein DFH08DRAFT_799599 [Mycena albidolilacea]
MPNGSIVADTDTGTPTAILPPDILYSHIPGAIAGAVGGDMSLFIFCNISGIVTVVIGFVPASFFLPALNHMLNGWGYPIYPLDLSQVEFDVDDNGNNFTACWATMVDLGAGSANDTVFGDSFMRNKSSVFKVGNNVAKSPTGAASIQFLSIFDPSIAAQDVQNARMVATAAALEVIGPVSGNASVEKYVPIIIGLLAGNLLLLIIGVVVYIQWSRGKSYEPVKVEFAEMNRGNMARRRGIQTKGYIHSIILCCLVFLVLGEVEEQIQKTGTTRARSQDLKIELANFDCHKSNLALWINQLIMLGTEPSQNPHKIGETEHYEGILYEKKHAFGARRVKWRMQTAKHCVDEGQVALLRGTAPPATSKDAEVTIRFLERSPTADEMCTVYLRAMISGIIPLAIAIFAFFSIYWGAVWKLAVHTLPGWIVPDSLESIPQHGFGSGWSLLEVANTGASVNLAAAISFEASGYDSSAAVTLIGAEARNENVYRLHFSRVIAQLDTGWESFALQLVTKPIAVVAQINHPQQIRQCRLCHLLDAQLDCVVCKPL